MPLLRKILLLCLIVAFVGELSALSVITQGIRNSQIYGIEFPGEARAYYASEAGIQSISKQEYVTAAFRVTEINIVTQGTALLRIYHSRPLREGELQQALGGGMDGAGVPGGATLIQRPLPPQVQAMVDRASGAVESATSTTVMKEYPIATHAHTIEYRIGSLGELLELHDELKKHWLKEPDEAGDANKEVKPRSLGGTLFRVEESM